MSFKAVLFDLDGTLLNTLRDIADSTNRALADLGFPPHTEEDYKQFVGGGRDVLALRSLPPDRRDPATLERMIAGINKHYNENWANNTRPYDGISEMLDNLIEKNIRIAILSNKPQEFVDLNVQKLLPDWKFEIANGSIPSVPKKPHPAAALKIAEKLGVEPSEILFLGDSDIDMQTAAAAGMFGVGAGWGFRSKAELLEAGAKMVADHPSEVIRLFESV